jgi:hypothetical protein
MSKVLSEQERLQYQLAGGDIARTIKENPKTNAENIFPLKEQLFLEVQNEDEILLHIAYKRAGIKTHG